MQFIVSSQLLLKTLQNVSGIISSNPTMAIADNFLFELKGNTLTLTATDIDTIMTTECEVSKSEGDGAVCIPSKILMDYLKSVADQPLNISIDEDQNIDIHSDNGKYKLKGEEAEKFPKTASIENPKTLTVPTHVLHDGIAYTLFCVSTDEMKKNMSGVFMEVKAGNLIFVSTDLQRLVKYSYANDSKEDMAGVIIPKKPLQQLNNILANDNSDIEILFNDQFFRIKNAQIEMVTRLIDGNFPDYNVVIPTNPPYKLEVSKNDLEGALRRINIFANKSTNQILLDISANKIKLQAEDIDFSYQGDETISCSYEGDNIKLSFNAKLLLELIHNLPGEMIDIGLSSPSKPVIFEPVAAEEDETDDLVMLNMPLVM